MRSLGKGLAFTALCGSAAALEIYDKPAAGLWFLIVLWVLFGEWN